MSDTLISAECLSKKFCRDLRQSLWYGAADLASTLVGRRGRQEEVLRTNEFWALKNASFELRRGECLGLVGANGAGKTTLLRILNGLIKPDHGSVAMRGRVGALIALGAGFNPVLTGRENIYVNAAILGFTKRDTRARLDEIVDFSGIRDFIDSPVQHYSSGMHMRLGFAIAAHLEPDILLVDEALAVGDIGYVIKCLNRIARLRQDGTGIVFVTHSELQLREVAARCLLLDRGEIKAAGPIDEIWPKYSDLLGAKRGSNDGILVEGGTARIDGLRMQSALAGNMVESYGSMRLGVAFTLAKAERGISMDLRFWNSSGQIATSLQSESSGYSLDLPSGASEVWVEIAYLPLIPGRYRIAGGIRRRGEFIGWSSSLGYVEVVGPPGRRVGEGLCATAGRFSVEVKPDGHLGT